MAKFEQLIALLWKTEGALRNGHCLFPSLVDPLHHHPFLVSF